MITTLVIGTTAYSSDGTAYAGFPGTVKTWAQGRIFNLKLTRSIEDYDSVEFSAISCGPQCPFVPGLAISLVTSDDDGSSPVVRLVGDLQRPHAAQGELGWTWAYQGTGLKRRADYVTLSSSSGSATASYNLSPDDPLALYFQQGLTVGAIVTDILQAGSNAAPLSAAGVGAYTSSAPWTLPAATVADLAALAIVPPVPVQLSGQGILNLLEQFIQNWMPPYCVWVEPDGTIRVQSLFALPPHTLTVPGTGASAADPVDWPQYAIDCTGCYTAWEIRGLDIEPAYLSVVEGTLIKAWTTAQQSSWTSADFLQPKGATDAGTITAVTTTSVTLHSDQSSVHWPANFWSDAGGYVYVEYLVGGQLAMRETRRVTSCSALTAGGSATITWDSSQPLESSTYTRYHLVGTNMPEAQVDRLFNIREPASGAVGTATFVGAHLYPRFPKGVAWGNMTRSSGAVGLIFYPAAKVLWSSSGAYPWFEEPVAIQLNPVTGQVDLSQPGVFVSAGIAGQTQLLQGGYPANYFQGLWYDIQMVVPYNRGDLSARSPASGYQGTAYTKYGIERTMVIPMDTFTFKGDLPAMQALAAEHLATVQDATITGSILLHFDDWTPSWDVLTVGYSLNIALPSGTPATDELAGVNLPVRSWTMEWHDSGALIRTILFEFSNLHRPFQGDALYLHPAFAPTTWGVSEGNVFLGGNMAGYSGQMGMDDFNEAGSQAWGRSGTANEPFRAGIEGANEAMQGTVDRGQESYRGHADAANEAQRSGFDDARDRMEAGSRNGLPGEGGGEIGGEPGGDFGGWGDEGEAGMAMLDGGGAAPRGSARPRPANRPAGPPAPSKAEMDRRDRQERESKTPMGASKALGGPALAARKIQLDDSPGAPKPTEGLPTGAAINPDPARPKLADLRGSREDVTPPAPPAPAPAPTPAPAPAPPPKPRTRLADSRGLRDDDSTSGEGG